jgi:hypothetical protein
MNQRQITARKRLRLIVAHSPTAQQRNGQRRRQQEHEASLSGLRDVPALPLRVGRHLAAWVVWHTARVSLIADAPPPAEFDAGQRV